MKWSFPIARLFGTQVRIHVTFFLLLAWVGISAYSAGGAEMTFFAILFVLSLFLCVLLHEFGHALAAKGYGINTPDITLLPIGGVARLERMPREPRHELVVAIAGPMVNVVIAAILLLILRVSTPILEISFEFNSFSGFLVNLMRVNVLLVLFNLVPAFPMDGGRVLRAFLAMKFSYARATTIAAVIGQSLAFVGGFLGFVLPAPLLIFIAFFVFLAAGAEASAARTEEALSGVKVADAMMTRFQVLQVGDKIERAVDFLLEGSQTDFPVVDSQDKVVGMVLRNDLMSALREYGEEGVVREAISDCHLTVKANEPLPETLQVLNQSKCRTVPVISGEDESLVGLLSLENVGELLMIKSALDSHDRRGKGHPFLESGESLLHR
ncbi:MAG: site-2 protease family protein [Verrucomicrobiae bacterium]|nr:site-2 protease family protein [Verrucomicrobiae bacterium]